MLSVRGMGPHFTPW